MATGRPLIFTSMVITDTESTDSITVTLPDDENLTITNELEESLVSGGQTIFNAFNQAIEVVTYDLDVLNSAVVGSYIQTNATLPSNAADIVMVGATGSVNVTIENTRVSAVRPFQDLRRDHALVKATLTSTTGINVANV